MSSKAKLKKRIRKLKRENRALIIEANAARVRAAHWYEEAKEADAAFILATWPTDAELKGADYDG